MQIFHEDGKQLTQSYLALSTPEITLINTVFSLSWAQGGINPQQ